MSANFDIFSFLNQIGHEGMSVEEMISEAEDGDLQCMNDLAMLYLNGDNETQADPEKALYWFKKMAEEGEPSGMYNLALMYAKGHGTKRDLAKAAEWMKKAADMGDEDAPKEAELYRKMSESYKKAVKGDAQAQADYANGLVLLWGCLEQAGSKKDFAESVEWAEKSVMQGNADGMRALGIAYLYGNGKKMDPIEAKKLFERGAELGSAACIDELGRMYTSGQYVKSDPNKGFELFKKAAEMGYGPAMKDLGWCYQFASGCECDMKKAVGWYERATKHIHDPQLERKVANFKMMGEYDPNWDDNKNTTAKEAKGKTSARRDATARLKDEARDANAKFSDELELWKKRCKEIDSVRNTEIEKIVNNAGLDEKAKQIREKFDKDRAEIEEQKSQLDKQLISTYGALKELGFLKISEKHKLKKEIEKINSHLMPELEKKRISINQSYNTELENVKEQLKAVRESAKKETENKYPYPERPKKDNSHEIKDKYLRNKRLRNDNKDFLKEAVMLCLDETGTPMRIYDLSFRISEIVDEYYSPQEVLEVLKEQCEWGLVKKVIIQSRAYYTKP